MRRVIHSKNVSISPLSITSIININTKHYFCTNKSKKSKIKFTDDFDDEKTNENIQEAKVEKETKKPFDRQTARQTITNVKFSDDDEDNKSYKSLIHKYLAINVGLDNILPRMLALKEKNPESITRTMNAFWMANVMYVSQQKFLENSFTRNQ